jgi:type I restriction enzyme S subunit
MSSKTKTAAMTEEATTALVPKLRFPEFLGAEGWQSKQLVDVCSKITQGGTPDTSKPEYWGGTINWMTPAEMGKTESPFIAATNRTITELGLNDCASDLLPLNSVILSVRAPIGHLAINTAPMAINQGCKGLIAGKSLDFYFLYCSLVGSKTRLIDLGAGNTFKELSGSALKSFKITVPTFPEQKKIAECLSLVDELMAAQARKVDALKTHKKGLMQQLFPREGETQPRLRFPEFQNAGEWKREPLGSLCARIMDGTHFSPKSKAGPRPYLTSKNIKDGRIDLSNLSYISEEDHAEIYSKCPVKLHDVLLTKDGANTGNCALNNLDFEFSLLSSVAVLRGNPSKLRQEFLFQSILSDSVQSLITESMSGQAITRITLAKIGGFTIPVPSLPEQHRIASCLSSLDALITLETQKLEALKTHKRGLMQQLFPSSEEVET